LTLVRWTREPLLHFLLIGLLLFLWYGRVAPVDDEGKRIVVSQAQEDLLVRQFETVWMRPPTAEERAGLVETYVRDEILYREGVALQLDENDPVIKRRVRQKLDVIFEETLAREPPTEAELQAYLDAHPAQFSRAAELSFEQVFLGEAGTAATAPARVTATLEALRAGAAPDSLGQATLLPARGEAQSADLIARDFGQEFADALQGQPIGQWGGPVRSGFGLHLVRVGAVQEPAAPALAEVRALVEREWESQRRKDALEQAYAKLRAEYEVEIEPAAAAVAKQP
jgi:parvulin-like peptidyl-prolyl isomerase